MSSEVSTETTSFRPWHLFTLAALLAATVAVFVVRPVEPAGLVLLVAAIGAAAAVGFGLYRTLSPLVAPDFREQTEIIGGRTRAALDREKTLVMRSIKELEFDRAMGKVSDQDFQEMGGRLRARAIVLMKQLDVDTLGYREQIARELAERLSIAIPSSAATSAVAPEDRSLCGKCSTSNETDARFCKNCGSPLT